MKVINKTWNNFWGEFLLVTFHKDNPDKWAPIKKKADWVQKYGTISEKSRVLVLGCGSGMLDICLAQKDIMVTGIDRIKPVIEIAKKEGGSFLVKFIHGDIKQAVFPDNKFNCILILETLGLMSKDEDLKLLEDSYRWLDNNGKIIIDSPEPSRAGSNYWEKSFPEGKLKFETSYDPAVSIQTIIPSLTGNEEEIRLYDPYSSDKGEYTGVKRYIYKKEELINITKRIGFDVKEVPHYWGDKYYALTGTKII